MADTTVQTMQPLVPLLGEISPDTPLEKLVRQSEGYFLAYPEISFISHTSRALLFALIRKHRFNCVAEIGTFFAGTTEVLARRCGKMAAAIFIPSMPITRADLPRPPRRGCSHYATLRSFTPRIR